MPVPAFLQTWIIPALQRARAAAPAPGAGILPVSMRPTWTTAPGYVGCGLLVLAACEAAHDGTWLIERDWPAQRISMYFTLAYYVGQFLATVAESRLVTRWLVPDAAAGLSRRVHPDFPVAAELDPQNNSGVIWTRMLCLGLWLTAACLLGGAVWHGASDCWGQSDWRKLGYALPALVGAWLLPRLVARRVSFQHRLRVGSA